MIKVFICHAGPDAALANRLRDDLKNAGHHVIVDTKEVLAGDKIVEFMNDSIETADHILIMVSPATPDARFQQAEKSASIMMDIKNAENRCAFIRIKGAPLRPLEATKRSIDLDNPDDASQYQSCLREICNMIESNNDKSDVSQIISDAFKADRANPFKRIRAEYYDDSSDLMAVFAPPDRAKLAALEEQQPCFLEGPRGTGKSMLLLSLRARNYLQKHRNTDSPEKNMIFGIYLKLTPGVLCNTGISSTIPAEPPSDDGLPQNNLHINIDLALQEFILCIAECLIGELSVCIHEKKLINCPATIEIALSMDLSKIIFGPGHSKIGRSFAEINEMISALRDKLAEYVRRKLIYGEQASIPVAHLSITSLNRLFAKTKSHLPQLSKCTTMILLDEYENLLPHQQCVVNTIMKLGAPHYSVNVAKKIGIRDTSSTTLGQELQEINDYRRIVLVYDLSNDLQRTAYDKLLKQIVENIMSNSNMNYVDIDTLLPRNKNLDLPSGDLQKHLDKLLERKNGSGDTIARSNPSYYHEAAMYRALHDNRRKKEFSGFQNLAFLSSGVIRYFQEILGVSYHLTIGDRSPEQSIKLTLPAQRQSEAVHIISEHTLTTLSKNVEKHGETLKFLLLDLGTCLRQKLLEHTSEPEAGRLTIKNAELLRQPEFAVLLSVLNLGVREGVFQTKEGRPAFRPKHTSDPQGVEFNLSRILAPVLEISPRLRWRTCVGAKLLGGLIEPHNDSRKRSLGKLLRSIVSTKTDDDLLESDQREQGGLFSP